jgi:hypothetical protein
METVEKIWGLTGRDEQGESNIFRVVKSLYNIVIVDTHFSKTIECTKKK